MPRCSLAQTVGCDMALDGSDIRRADVATLLVVLARLWAMVPKEIEDRLSFALKELPA